MRNETNNIEKTFNEIEVGDVVVEYYAYDYANYTTEWTVIKVTAKFFTIQDGDTTKRFGKQDSTQLNTNNYFTKWTIK